MNDARLSLSRGLLWWVALVALLPACVLAEAENATAALDEHLQPLAPLVGKTWRGELSGPEGEAPKIDVSRWERALNGKAVRVMHSVNDGEYGGETLIVWDQKTEQLVFFYFTTAGFRTEGTFRVEDGKFYSREVVEGNDQGITEVESISEVLPDGRLQGSTRYLRKGEWVEGHKVIYVEAPDADVVLR